MGEFLFTMIGFVMLDIALEIFTGYPLFGRKRQIGWSNIIAKRISKWRLR